MIHYTAQAGQPAINNMNLRQVMAPRIGAHRGGFRYAGGRFMINMYNPGDVQATATSIQAGVGVFADDAALPAAGDFVSVSGLTACIGVQVLRSNGGNFVHGATAHFNGNYHNVAGWNAIANGVAGMAGALYAIVISTSDTTAFWQSNTIVRDFGGHLLALGVNRGNILFYHSCHSGVAFLVCRDGIMGEPQNPNDFAH